MIEQIQLLARLLEQACRGSGKVEPAKRASWRQFIWATDSPSNALRAYQGQQQHWPQQAAALNKLNQLEPSFARPLGRLSFCQPPLAARLSVTQPVSQSVSQSNSQSGCLAHPGNTSSSPRLNQKRPDWTGLNETRTTLESGAEQANEGDE